MKKSAFKLHSWFALFACVPLLVISITGSILVYKQEIDRWLMPERAVVVNVADDQVRLDLDTLKHAVNQQLPDHEIGTWELFDDKVRADAVYVIERGTFDFQKIFLNQYTGDILSEPVALNHYLTDWLVELHYTFLADHEGMLVALIFAFILVVLGVTGLIMHSRFWKHFFTFRTGRALAILFSDIHKFVGVLASPVLLILGLTGTYWNIAGYVHELEEHAHTDGFVLTQRMYNDDVSLQRVHDQAIAEVDGLKPTYLVLAYEPDSHFAVYGWVPTGNPLYSQYSSGAMFDAQTGALKMSWDIRNLPFLQKLVDSFRELHFGTFAGEVSKLLWCVLGAAPVILTITGVYMWQSRKRKRARSKKNRAARQQHAFD